MSHTSDCVTGIRSCHTHRNYVTDIRPVQQISDLCRRHPAYVTDIRSRVQYRRPAYVTDVRAANPILASPSPVLASPSPDLVAPSPVLVAPSTVKASSSPVLVAPTPVRMAPRPVLMVHGQSWQVWQSWQVCGQHSESATRIPSHGPEFRRQNCFLGTPCGLLVQGPTVGLGPCGAPFGAQGLHWLHWLGPFGP